MGVGWKVFLILFAIIAVVFLVIALTPQKAGPYPAPSPGVPTTPSGIQCPSDLTWAGTMTVQNVLNTTGAQTYDNTMNIYSVNGDGSLNYVTQITDTTAGAVSLTCGVPYAAKILSVNSKEVAGDSSRLRRVISSSGAANVRVDDMGVLYFTPTGAMGAITVGSENHGHLEVRAFNVLQNAYMYKVDSADSGTTYTSLDGVRFTNASEAAVTTVGLGGEFHVKLYARTNHSDLDFNDLGVYFLVDAATDTWKEPTIKFDGATATRVDGSFNADESIAYSNYEYAYLISKDRHLLNNNQIEIDIQFFALAGQNPAGAHNISTDFAAIGRYASTADSTDLKVGSVDDSSSRTSVYTLFDVEWAIA